MHSDAERLKWGGEPCCLSAGRCLFAVINALKMKSKASVWPKEFTDDESFSCFLFDGIDGLGIS